MNEAAAQSQKKVAKLDDETSDLRSEYRAIQEQIASLSVYNEQAQKLVDAQEAQVAEFESQVGEATNVGRGVTPLMGRMVDALEQFVRLDVPFLQAERKERVAQLRSMLDRPDVTEAEKYRRIMEAYQIENEYGRTIEAYRGELEQDGNTRTVEFLRVGRVALVYRTTDGGRIAAWNTSEKRWEDLPSGYQGAVKKGFRVAQKQAAPDLFPVPIAAPQEPSR